jgi:hypothetical protein
MTSIATDAPRLEAALPTERKMKADWLRDVILGGQDGLVNILGIVLGDRQQRIAFRAARRRLRGSGRPRHRESLPSDFLTKLCDKRRST